MSNFYRTGFYPKDQGLSVRGSEAEGRKSGKQGCAPI